MGYIKEVFTGAALENY
jgi:hypothetical protein